MVQALPTTAHVFASKLHYYGLGVRGLIVTPPRDVLAMEATAIVFRVHTRYSGARVHAQLVVHAAFAPSDLSITIPSVNLLHHSESAIYTPQSRTHA
ncbi:hypothetical protein SNOG_11265 [Parastagonospora nodorum SN15]|uniref:Uncharacterized protein n=1 Tax=Phaeosphaeria nodorum (strain SN15 / ATCC MYA-4574 / FGSC 10173) TaxID=321614 RepID=Q0UAE9_PHANO|nr:hypothetical protein SNOG_11265 [Parastagonospora nodorum SN15]EAT81764.1 hypothetical protein SNOG_11265 [Parastagonospora nodorum SN15]